ncbi:MAG: hypothetical protein FWG65_10800 [Turicibacter sp.]|nr:hypothetical protein [Turicibacter sp.]
MSIRIALGLALDSLPHTPLYRVDFNLSNGFENYFLKTLDGVLCKSCGGLSSLLNICLVYFNLML